MRDRELIAGVVFVVVLVAASFALLIWAEPPTIIPTISGPVP